MKIAKTLASLGSATLIAILPAAFPSFAFGETVKVILSGDLEVPPVKTTASRSGTVTVNPDKTVSGTVATTGLEATMAHIHMGPEGKSGPPIITLEKKGQTDWMVPAGAKLTDEQYKAYKAGNLYINVHTAAHKDGEIRGQLRP